ncbi:hypothetical protein L9F63_012879 [Diploptera punctata]|uniref:Cytochrome P450 n=1 Tax=Diploptera punctata TaxID=6984 RepID=A0AAD8END4_DIPPU|nr:hypothetical protein L9F63_012879 [Diploptera punctata]
MLVRIASASGKLAYGHQQNVVRHAYQVLVRRNTTVTATQTLPRDWENARPFEEVPGPKALPIVGNIWRFLPGIGAFAGMDPLDAMIRFIQIYGDICKLEGIPGRNTMVFVANPDEIEKLYRTRQPENTRRCRTLNTFKYVLRKDLYKEVGDLVSSQGAQWQKFRSKVNPTMMQPRSTKLYVGPMDTVANDFIKRIRELREENTKATEIEERTHMEPVLGSRDIAAAAAENNEFKDIGFATLSPFQNKSYSGFVYPQKPFGLGGFEDPNSERETRMVTCNHQD